MTKPFVSVIIPVYNDPERLKLCLDALRKQTYPKNSFEIIVVDNDSDPPLNLNTLKEYSNVILESENKRSSYAARNKGISVAKGEILAFTDADCIPDYKWLENGVTELVDTNHGVVLGGRIDVFVRDHDNPSPIELWEYLFSFPNKKFIEQSNFSVTANLFAFRKVMDDVGGFDDRFYSCGDQEWCKRAVNKGHELFYSDDVAVSHPARYSFHQLFERQTRIVRGMYLLNKHENKNNLVSLLNTSKYLLPPVLSVYDTVSNDKFKKLLKHGDKLKVIWITIVIRMIKAWEAAKILLNFRQVN